MMSGGRPPATALANDEIRQLLQIAMNGAQHYRRALSALRSAPDGIVDNGLENCRERDAVTAGQIRQIEARSISSLSHLRSDGTIGGLVGKRDVLRVECPTCGEAKLTLRAYQKKPGD
jgi:hypothetical protein